MNSHTAVEAPGPLRVVRRLGWTLLCLLLLWSASLRAQDDSRPSFVRPSDAPKYASDRLLVRFRPGTTKATQTAIHARTGAALLHRFRIVPGLQVVRLAPGAALNDVLQQYRSDPSVLYAQPDYLRPLLETTPNDPQFSSLWAMKNTGQSGGKLDADIDATNAWDLSTGSSSVFVGTIDTGVDYNHPDLSANIYFSPTDCNSNHVDDDGDGYIDDCHGINTANHTSDPMDNNDHGTHVAGTIGAAGNNATGVVGVNWHVTIVPCRAADASGGLPDSAIIECLEWFDTLKDHGMNLVATNNSYGGPLADSAMYDAIKTHLDRGILFIAAAGNGGSDNVGDNNDTVPHYPSSYDLANVIAVAATDRTDALGTFSNFGRHSVHLGAPGVSILSTVPLADGSYATFSGTSMATPHVTGAVALLKAQNPALEWWEIRNLLLDSGDSIASLAGKTLSGKRLNVFNAMTCSGRTVQGRLQPTSSPTTATVGSDGLTLRVINANCAAPAGALSVTVNPGGNTVSLHDDGAGGDQAAGDGIYSGTWSPAQPGSYTLTFPGNDTVSATALLPYVYSLPAYSYRHIGGANLNLGDDDAAQITSPFPIKFGNANFTNLWVSSNGTISLTSAFSSPLGDRIPSATAATLIAPFWQDLFPQPGTAQNVFWQVTGSAPTRELVVEWRNVPPFGQPDLTQNVTFEVVFFEDTTKADQVLFNYADVTFGAGAMPNCCNGEFGASASVGVQTSANAGVQYSFMKPVLSSGMALLFRTATQDFQMAVQPPLQLSLATVPSPAYPGTLTTTNGYSGLVSFACVAGITAAPDSCSASPTSVTPTGGGAPFTVNATAAAAGDYFFNLQAVGNDADATAQQLELELRTVDFSVSGPPATIEVKRGTSQRTGAQLSVSAPFFSSTPFSFPLTVGCAGLPAGATCVFDTQPPSSLNSWSTGMTVQTSPQTPTGTYNAALSGTATYNGQLTRSAPFQLIVDPHPDFTVTQTSGPLVVRRGQTTQGSARIDFLDGFTGPVSTNCFGGITNPTSVNGPDPQDYTQTVNGGTPGNYNFTYGGCATIGGVFVSHSTSVPWSIIDYQLNSPAAANGLPGLSSWDIPVSLQSLNGAFTVTATCDATAIAPAATCSIPAAPASIADKGTVNTTVHIVAPAAVSNGTFTIPVHTAETPASGLSHDGSISLSIQEFSLHQAGIPPVVVGVGQTTAALAFTVLPAPGFGTPITLSCPGLPAGASCQFTVNPVTPASVAVPVGVSVTTTAGTTPLANFTLNVVGTANGIVKQLDVPFTIQPFDYSLQASPATVSVVRGGLTTTTISAPAVNAGSGVVHLSCAGSGNGDACGWTQLVQFNGSTQVAVGAASTAGNTATATIYGTVNGSMQRSTQVAINVQDYTVSATPTSSTVPPTANAVFTISATGQNGFNRSIPLSCYSLSADASCSFNPPAIVPGQTSTLTVTPAPNVSLTAHSFQAGSDLDNVLKTVNLTARFSSLAASYTLTLSPTTKTVQAGGSTTYALAVKATSTTSPGVVTFSCAPPVPPGVTCSFSPASLTPTSTAANVTLTVSTTAATPAGAQTLVIQGATASQSRTVNGTLQVTDFTVDASPAVRILPSPGGSTTYTVNLAAVNGFASAVALSCTGLPAGWTCGFAPSSVTPPNSSTLTVTTTSAPFGPVNITIQGAAGGLIHTKTVELDNGSNDYVLSTAQPLVAVRPGQTAPFSISAARYGTFSALVALSCSPNPPATGATCGISPNPADLTSGSGTTATLNVSTTGGTTPIGDYAFNFHATGGGSTHDLPLTLRVNDFAVASSASPQTIEQAGSATYNVTVSSLNNYSSPVTLSCAAFSSSGMSCGFSQNNFVPASTGTNVTVTVTADPNATVASGQTFNVIASDGTTSHSATLGYSTILVQDFQLALDSNATQTVTSGAQTGWATHLLPLNQFSASVTTTCAITGAPTGAVCSATPSPVAIGSGVQQPVTVAITTTSSTPAGNYAVQVTASGGGKTHVLNTTLVVQHATLTISPTSRTIPPGAGTTYTITASGQNGFASQLVLGCSNPPAGVTCSFNPPAVTPGSGSSTMTVMAPSTITSGAKTISVIGSVLGVPPVAQSNASLTISTTAASFTLTNSTATKSVNVGGGSTTYSLSVRATSTLSPGMVTLSCVPPLPAGVSCSFSANNFTPTTTARAVTATVTATGAVPAGSYPITFQAASTSQLRQANGTLNVADFALVVNPASQQIGSTTGGSAQYDVTLSTASGFASSVALSCAGLPTGTTCGFAPSSVTPTVAGAHSTLTVTTTASTPGGTNNFNVQGTSGSLSHSQQISVIVDPRDFTVSPSPSSIAVLAGGSNTTTISTAALGGLSGNVDLSCTNITPATAQLSCGFAPATVAVGSSSVLTLNGTANLAGGTYTVTVQGNMTTPVARTHTTTVTVTVPDFGVGATPASQTVTPGATADYTVTTSALNGFSGTVGFSCAVLTAPAGTSCAVDLASVAAGSGTAMHVTTSSGTPTGTYTVRLTGTSGITTHTFDVQVTVGSAVDFTMTTSTPSRSVNRSSITSYSVTLTAQGGFGESVSLSCGGAPPGVSCGSLAAFVPSALGTTKSVTVIVGSSAVSGSYSFQINAKSATKQHSVTVQLTIN